MLLVSRDYEGKQIIALNPTSDAAYREHGALHVTLKQCDAALADYESHAEHNSREALTE